MTDHDDEEGKEQGERSCWCVRLEAIRWLQVPALNSDEIRVEVAAQYNRLKVQDQEVWGAKSEVRSEIQCAGANSFQHVS